MSRPKPTDLATPEVALASYLDELLQTATQAAQQEVVVAPEVTPVPAPAPQPDPAAELARKQARLEQLARIKAQAQARQQAIKAKPVQTPVATAPVAVATPTPEPAEVVPPEPAPPEGRPGWGNQDFECLLFRVGGLQLAVPLVLLGAIHRMDTDITPIPGRPRWYMGMMPVGKQNLKVVDTAEWVMAGRVPPDARQGYRFVIRLDDSDWGLACDEVAQSFRLSPDDVRWRTARSKRPWLAGTVVQHMCALLDVGSMAALLGRAEREHRLDMG
ncbi:MAG: chemotaxis protein CheW [Marinobacter sp.]|nr:chemotaxis protein CheW [Marinobacter sp.]